MCHHAGHSESADGNVLGCAQQHVDKHREDSHIETISGGHAGQNTIGHAMGYVHNGHSEPGYNITDQIASYRILGQPLQDRYDAGKKREETPALPAIAQRRGNTLISGVIPCILYDQFLCENIAMYAVLWLYFWFTLCALRVAIVIVVVKRFGSRETKKEKKQSEELNNIC